MQRPITGTNPRGRGRFWKDITWGGKASLSQVVPPAIGPVAVTLTTPGTIFQYDMWPGRLVGLFAIMQPSTLPAFVADGTTWTITWTVGIGLGRVHELLVFSQQWAPPYAPAVLLTESGGTLQIPATQLPPLAELSNAAATAGATYGVRFSAFAAPISLGGLGLEELGGSGG